MINKGRTFCVASNKKCIWWNHYNNIRVCPVIDFLQRSIFHECLLTKLWLFASKYKCRHWHRASRKPLPRSQEPWEQCLAPRNLYAAAQYARNRYDSTGCEGRGGGRGGRGWGMVNLCEKLYDKFLKICSGVHSNASNAAVRREIGCFPLIVTIIISMLNFWSHIVVERTHKCCNEGSPVNGGCSRNMVLFMQTNL